MGLLQNYGVALNGDEGAFLTPNLHVDDAGAFASADLAEKLSLCVVLVAVIVDGNHFDLSADAMPANSTRG